LLKPDNHFEYPCINRSVAHSKLHGVISSHIKCKTLFSIEESR